MRVIFFLHHAPRSLIFRAMKALVLFLVTFLPLEARAASFDCVPVDPPHEQGAERFYKIEISDSEARIEMAGMVGPFVTITDGATLAYSHYSADASAAGAAWTLMGEQAYVISLVYFGSWWAANLRIKGEESDLRCELRD